LSLEEEKRYLLAAPQPLQNVAIVILETVMNALKSISFVSRTLIFHKIF
jgi:hypothetical protein